MTNTENSFIASAKRVIDIEAKAISALNHRLDAHFVDACHLLRQCKGKVVVSGMGKSGHIGNKIAATLASTGTPAFFMPSNKSPSSLDIRVSRLLLSWSSVCLAAPR